MEPITNSSIARHYASMISIRRTGRSTSFALFQWILLLGAAGSGVLATETLLRGQTTSTHSPPTEQASENQAASVEFFEDRIRPVLIESCYDCHAADTDASGGLLLDSKDGWQAGGDSGQAIVPDDATASLLFEVISYENPELQMPPDGKLPNSVIDDFRTWINSGAADPRQGEAPNKKQTGLPVERAEDHWAYRPITRPQVPDEALGKNPVDAFIDAKLQAEQLKAGERATTEVILRRVSFDLTGLPPSPTDFHSLQKDSSEAALGRLVNRLMASPRFGETIARHWMDVARYADSITLRGFVLPQAWRYRDYLIESFNQDRSFQQMIREQIAGDLMAQTTPAPDKDLKQQQRQLVATGFLALGNTNLEQQDKTQLEMDFIDEQLEVIGRAFLGQTLGCARCHDHKFDPIPTSDYYGLAGIFRSAVALDHDNVSKWIEQPLPLDESNTRYYRELDARHRKLEKQIGELKKQLTEVTDGGKNVLSVADLNGLVIDSRDAEFVGDWKHSNNIKPHVGDGYVYTSASEKTQTATFEPAELRPGEYEVRFAYTPHPNRSSKTLVRVFSADGEKEFHIDQRKAGEDSLWVSLGKHRFEKDGQAYVLVSNIAANGAVVVDAVQFLSLSAVSQLVDIEQAADGGLNPAEAEANVQLEKQLQSEIARLQSEQKELKNALEARPKYLTVVERGPVGDIPIHIRGDVHNLGQVVPRGFLTAVRPRVKPEFEKRSGRLDFANWLADDRNPLTARVYANRVWLWLMGQGLVATPNNFGTTGREPSHPELLDWLASELIRSNWSTKHLVRVIVSSEAYRRSSANLDAEANELDPDNRLYWRGHRRRLGVEALRDTMLVMCDEIDFTMGGSLIRNSTKADYDYGHSTTRRSIYHPVFRNSLPELYEAFDFADTSVSTGRRPRSTVSTQALVLMNHPWVIERVQRAAELQWLKLKDHWNHDSIQRAVEELYIQALGRQPSVGELDLAVEFLIQTDDENTDDQHFVARDSEHRKQRRRRLTQFIHSLSASLDFRYLD